MRFFLLLALSLGCLRIFTSCSSTEISSGERYASRGSSGGRSAFVRGKTNDSDIFTSLGTPDIVVKDRKGREIWTYTFKSYDSASGLFSDALYLYGGYQTFGPSWGAAYDLMVTFDEDGVVEDFAIVSSQFRNSELN